MEEQALISELNLSNLPEDCLSNILSRTSPRDACGCAVLCSKLRSAAQSDIVWKKFLPHCWEYIVSRSVSPSEFASKKELYFHLCHSLVLVDGTKNKSFSLDKNSGKICLTLGPGEISMTWDKNSFRATMEEFGLSYFKLPGYHQPAFLDENYKPAISRFSEVTHIDDVGQLLIQATVKRRFLSPNTHYVAYFLYESRFNMLELPPLLGVGVRFVEEGIEKNVINDAYFDDDPSLRDNEGFHPRHRDDGWTEIEMGEFFNGDVDVDVDVDADDDGGDVVEIFLWEVRGAYIRMIRNGLVVQGIELRPKV